MTALEQSAELGRKAAEAIHRKHDRGIANHFITYQSKFVTAAQPIERKALVEAFNAAYQEESSYYIGAL